MVCPRCNIARTAGLCKQCQTEQRLEEERQDGLQGDISNTSWNSREPELEGRD